MLTRCRKQQQIKNRKIIECIEIAKSKVKVNEYDGLWYCSKCIQCYKTRKVIDRCPICLVQYTIDTGNVFLTQCQHTFCKKCFFDYLDSTSKKNRRISGPFIRSASAFENRRTNLLAERSVSKPTIKCYEVESFKCPICKHSYKEVERKKIPKNLLLTSLLETLNIRSPNCGHSCSECAC